MLFNQLHRHVPSSFCTDGFVAKLNAAGTALLYSTFLGGNDEDEVRAVAVDSSGDAYVTGFTRSDDFPITPGSFQQSKPSGFAGFVSKLNSSGSALMYSTFFVGPDSYDGIALDGAGNAYITGIVSASAGLPTTPSAYQQTANGASDAYVTKFNASGSSLVYSTFIGGSDDERTFGIAVNSSGEAYITGGTTSADFPTTVSAFQRVKRSPRFFYDSCFITKFNSTGSALSYSSYLGGSDGGQIGTSCSGIALGRFGNVYVSGSTISSDFPTTPDAFMKTNTAGDLDAFAAQIMPLCPLKAGNLTVTICKPGNGTSVTTPVIIMAGARDTLPVKLVEIFVDGIKVYQAKLAAIMVRWPMSAGTHQVTVRARDYVNQPFSASVNVSVGP